MFFFIGTGMILNSRAVIFLLPLLISVLTINRAHADVDDCIITLSPFELNYGDQRRDSQTFISTSKGGVSQLSPRSSNLTVVCASDEFMRLKFTGSANSNGDFLWGSSGGLAIQIASTVLDGQNVKLTKTKHKGIVISGIVADSQLLSVDDEITIGNNSAIRGKNLNAVITVMPSLLETSFKIPESKQLEEVIVAELLNEN